MKKDNKYLTFIIIPFLFVTISIFFVLYIDYFMVRKIVYSNIEALKKSYIDFEKNEAKLRVNNIIKYIKNIKRNFPNLSNDKLQRLVIEWIKENQNENKYIFVYKLINKNGGDKFAIMLINPNRKDLEGKYLSTNYKDIKGNKFREIMLKQVLKNGETFVTYYYKKPDSKKIAKKISFFKYYKDFNWIIATGVYFDFKNKFIKKYEEKILKEQKETFIKLLMLILSLTLISVLFLWIIFNKLRKSIIHKNELIIKQAEELKKEAINREEYLKKLENDYEIIKNLKKENEKLIETLEEKVKKQVEEIRKKDKMLMQQSKLASMGEMISNIAHQWRQPLNTLSSMLIILNLKRQTGEVGDKDIDFCLKESEKIIQNMSKTIDDFQKFFSSTKEKEKFNVKEIILENKEILKPTLIDYRITLEINCNDYFIYGYKDSLKQVILIILNNAIDTISKKREGIIIVKCEIKDKEFILKIIDSGGGVPEEIIDRIFEPYFTTNHKTQGKGLGLYIAMEIITKQFNGSISVKNVEFEYKNKKQKGAEFIIRFPK